MKSFVTAQLDEDTMKYLRINTEMKVGGWGHTGHVLTPRELVKQAVGCEILVLSYEPVDDFVLGNLPEVRFISCTRGGMENFDKKALENHPDVIVCNAPGRNANAVSDLALALMLDISRNISLSSHYIRNRDWEHAQWFKAGRLKEKFFMGYELEGKTLGLIGFGEIGARVARRANGFGMNVLTYDPYVKSLPESVERTELNTLLRCSDFVSLHCKVTPETNRIICRKTLEQMKPTAFLINTARGSLVDEEALFDALKGRRIAGAAMDTLATEPIPFNHPFLELENVTITPHIGGASHDIVCQQSQIVMEDICAFLEGRRPTHVWP